MGKVFVFCQASGDVKYAFSLYEKYKEQGEVQVVLPPNQPCIDFVKELLGAGSVVLPPPPQFSVRKPWRALKARFFCAELYKTWFKGVRDADVYFFSQEFDWFSLGFIHKLAKQGCRVVLYEHYSHDPHPVSGVSFMQWLSLKLYCFVAQAPFVYCRLGEHKERYQRVLQLRERCCEIEKTPAQYDEKIFSTFAFPVPNAEAGVLWIDSPDDGAIFNYEHTTREILSALKKENLKVFVKPHPRLPLHRLYSDFDIEILPKEVPGEFLPLKRFRAVFGVESSLLGNAARTVSAYSFLRLYEWKDAGGQAYSERLLGKASGGKVCYVESISEVTNLLGREAS